MYPVAASAFPGGPHCGRESWEFSACSSVLPFPGSDTCLVYVPQFGAPSESLTHSIPHSFSVKSLSAFAEGLTDTLLLCPVRALRLSLRRSRYRSRLHCRPSRAVSSLTVSIFCEWSLLRQGRLPMHWVPLEPMGFAVAPPISPYTGPGQSPRLDVSPLGLRLVFTALA